ncbi:MAG: Protein translocase subunit SecE [Chlamydiales bacterium]|nr:Protein translocase subunit SecE [Chlamydiales bacterium]MCH9619182.1 Protein translocase subunit SecE [Chlamydiales bacterium]MCH9622444.1 Protein translocase subunit SecE [Chlamydiales bacterium]
MQRVKAIQKMEAKKQTKADAQSLVKFFGDVKQELKRVDWTSKDELRAYTKIVVACIFSFGLSIYFVDLIIRGSLDFMNLFVKWLVG